MMAVSSKHMPTEVGNYLDLQMGPKGITTAAKILTVRHSDTAKIQLGRFKRPFFLDKKEAFKADSFNLKRWLFFLV